MDIKRVACVGAGIMGHGWATLFTMNGYPVNIQARRKESIEKALGLIKVELNLLAEKDVITHRDAVAALERVRGMTDLSKAVSEADYIQESVFNDIDSKKKVFKEIDDAAPQESIIASSGTLPMTEIQKVTSRPERCLIVHGSNPPYLLPFVELVPGKATSKRVVEVSLQFIRKLGKDPVISSEDQKLIHHRLEGAISRETVKLVEEGVTIKDIDRAILGGIGIRWALTGIILTFGYRMDFGNISDNVPMSSTQEKMMEALKKTDFIKGKTYHDLIRWRDVKLIDLLRVLEWFPKRS